MVVVVDPLAGFVKVTSGGVVATVLVTVSELVAGEPMPFEHASAKVLAPDPSETVIGLEAGLPSSVQVGAGYPVTIQPRFVEPAVVLVPSLDVKLVIAGA